MSSRGSSASRPRWWPRAWKNWPGPAIWRSAARATQREDFTGVAVPFYESWLHTDNLPMFRAMDAAPAREVG